MSQEDTDHGATVRYVDKLHIGLPVEEAATTSHQTFQNQFAYLKSKPAK